MSTLPTEDKLLTQEELAEILQVPVPTIRRWHFNETGPKRLKLGKHVRYRWSDVQMWMIERETKR